jgi:hypothetical protein
VRYLILVAAAAALTGCGVFRSSSVIVQAQQRYESARAAGAGAKAPYEFTLGTEFLRKAREEAGYSDYQVAERLAQQAQALLAEAERQATGAEPKAAPRDTGSEE